MAGGELRREPWTSAACSSTTYPRAHGSELRRETKDDVPLSRQAAHGDREGSWLELAPRISRYTSLSRSLASTCICICIGKNIVEYPIYFFLSAVYIYAYVLITAVCIPKEYYIWSMHISIYSLRF